MINPVTDKSLGKETIEWPESRQQSFFNRLSHYHCRRSHPSSVPSDLNEGFGREKLNDDPPSPDRLTHSILAKEGEGIS